MDVVLGPHPRSRGFSLIQLMTALGVISTSLSLALPSWSILTQSNQVQSARSEFMSNLNYARSTAVIKNVPITLCPSTDLESCNNDYTSWHNGYIIFTDTNANRQRELSEQILRIKQGHKSGLRIQTSRGRRSIRFNTDGSAWGSNLSMRFCTNQQIKDNRSILISGTGRPRFSPELSNGNPISCD